jgi:hypothetical protein
VAEAGPVKAALERMAAAAAAAHGGQQEKQGRAVVMGSSIGWIVFYLTLGYGVPTQGFEILLSLHSVALSVGRRCGCTVADPPAGNEGDGGGAGAAAAGGGGGGGAGRAEAAETGTEAAAETALPAAAAAAASSASFVLADLLESDLVGVELVVLTDQCWDSALVDACRMHLAQGLESGAVVIAYTNALGQGDVGEAAFTLRATMQRPVTWNANQSFYVYERSTCS